MLFEAQAPANVAFIKYMGKTCDIKNTPINPSLSWTLNHLVSTVQLELREKYQERDIFFNQEDQCQNISIKEKMTSLNCVSLDAQKRFLKHLEYLKSQFDLKRSFIIRSCNNFPSDVGLASSASSFAALTKAFAKAVKKLKGQDLNPVQCAALSRRGSGSSCRSFFSGCLWMPNGKLVPIKFPENWMHIVVLTSKKKKSISSSKAHKIVLTSPLYKNRPQRVEKRLSFFLKALEHKNWEELYRIAKAEFCDMMDLFQTACPSFSYFTKDTITVLGIVDSIWKENRDGPLITMDAGPHVHLIWRKDQRNLMLKSKKLGLEGFPILASPCCQKIFKSTL